MFERPRNTALACLLFAAVAGYFVIGHYLYKVPIGLDESAFLFGEPLQSAGDALRSQSPARRFGRRSCWVSR